MRQMGETTVKPPRNHSLDLVKGIACLFVVCMHCEFPGYLGVLVQCVARWAVPFFFMVSGYFCYRAQGVTNYPRKVRHIASIVLFASTVYVIYRALTGGSFAITRRQLFEWVVLNEPVIVAGQLWFLFALLYDYIVFGLLDTGGIVGLTKALIPINLVLYLVLAQGAHLAGYKVPNPIYRNFLIEGLLLFSLGYWLHAYERRIKVPNGLLVAGIVLFTVLCPIERELIGRDFGINIVTFPQVLCIFLFCIQNPSLGEKSTLRVLGERYSLYVYVLHPLFWQLLERFYKLYGLKKMTMANYAMPPLCIMLSIIASVVVVWCKDAIGRRRA